MAGFANVLHPHANFINGIFNNINVKYLFLKSSDFYTEIYLILSQRNNTQETIHFECHLRFPNVH